jgi:acetyl-CoA carboxylase alpha subunit
VGFGVMDAIIEEPLGGAHRNPVGAFPFIKEAIVNTIECAPAAPPL